MEGLNRNDYLSAYDHLSRHDRRVRSRSDFENEMSEGFYPQIKYRFLESSPINDSLIVIKYEKTQPDLSSLMGSLLSNAFSYESKSSDDIQKEIESQISDLPTLTIIDYQKMLKEEGEWKVLYNFTKQDILSNYHDQINDKQFSSLRANLLQAQEIDPTDLDVSSKLKQVDSLITIEESKQAYIDSIEIFNIKTKVYDTYLGNYPATLFNLKNRGGKTLKKVSVVVLFKDDNNQIIHENEYFPVLVSDYSDDRPLKPNYVWSSSRNRYFVCEDCPSGLKNGNIEIEINDIEFLD